MFLSTARIHLAFVQSTLSRLCINHHHHLCNPYYCRRTVTLCSEKRKNNPAKLVTSSWLRDKRDDVTILDVRGRVEKVGGRVENGEQAVNYVSDHDAFVDGHVPGARFIDWREIDISTKDGIIRFGEDMSEAGVQRDDTVVVYDWGDMLFATRLWLSLFIAGCSDVRVLNGGWKSWDDSGAPVSSDTACPLTIYTDFEADFSKASPNHIYVSSMSLEEMRKVVKCNLDKSGAKIYPQSLLIDGRSHKQYIGLERRAARGGHIPSAINLPYRRLLEDSGIGIKTDEDIAHIFKDTVSQERLMNSSDIICYCNGGVASSLVVFCLIRCSLNVGPIRNYCGSFNEWGNLSDTPIENG